MRDFSRTLNRLKRHALRNRSAGGCRSHPVITDNSLQFSLGYLHLDLVFFKRLPLCVRNPLGNG
jgi:hypothetical protein